MSFLGKRTSFSTNPRNNPRNRFTLEAVEALGREKLARIIADYQRWPFAPQGPVPVPAVPPKGRRGGTLRGRPPLLEHESRSGFYQGWSEDLTLEVLRVATLALARLDRGNTGKTESPNERVPGLIAKHRGLSVSASTLKHVRGADTPPQPAVTVFAFGGAEARKRARQRLRQSRKLPVLTLRERAIGEILRFAGTR